MRDLTPLLLLLTLAVTACGGGGGGSAPPPPAPPNQPPVAVISAPATAVIGATVVLDGSGSSDSDGSITGYQWQQVEGPEVELAGSASAEASFTAPGVNGDTSFAFSLTVTDNSGAEASSSASVIVEGSAGGVTYSLSGSVLASSNQAVDGDTNDPANMYLANDTLASAQPLANPITLGGYVNLPGTGAEGRSQVAGDVDDYYRLELLEGQSVTLLVADFETADADLYLYSEQGEIVDFSIETGEIETVTAPASGTWFANVSAFAGATNYILAVGNQALEGNRQQPDIVAGAIVVEYRDAAAAGPAGGPGSRAPPR